MLGGGSLSVQRPQQYKPQGNRAPALCQAPPCPPSNVSMSARHTFPRAPLQTTHPTPTPPHLPRHPSTHHTPSTPHRKRSKGMSPSDYNKGTVTAAGLIRCSCHNTDITMSEFETHSNSQIHRPAEYIFIRSLDISLKVSRGLGDEQGARVQESGLVGALQL